MLYGILSWLCVAVLAGIDQLIKGWATAELLPVGSMPLIPKVIELRYVLNDGMAFSMLSGQRWLLIAVTGVVLVAVMGMLLVRRMSRLERVAWVLVAGGGIGNLIDRVLNGVVVDYFNLLFMRFAVFNFADVCVCVGVGLLILTLLVELYQEGKSGKKPDAAPSEQNDAEA